MLEPFIRYAHTLRHLKAGQVVGRLSLSAKRYFRRSASIMAPAYLQVDWLLKGGFLHHDPWNTRADVLNGRFCFLNQVGMLGKQVCWHDAGKWAPLWQFNLHYFNYLHLLEPTEQEALCRDWLAVHSVGAEPAWHPYPTALRTINWCKVELQAPDLLQSLYRQSAYLYRNVETHLLGNHLLENARALVFAGSFFRGQGEGDRWLQKGLQIYREQTPEQVLADGGHFERSPMYHALMLEGYLDVLNLLPDDHPDRPWLTEVTQSMVDFVAAMTHPDGQLALFNDSTQEIAPPPNMLLDYARRVGSLTPREQLAFPETGYFISRHGDNYLVIDGGPIGPDYLPAHAHADIFSYELSLEGQRFIVDSGVYEYESGSMRDYVRSTPAHNTVCIDGVDQAECWSSFRVARRYAPRDVTFKNGRFSGWFDGYAKLIGDGIRHHRTIEVTDEVQRIAVSDTIEGRGSHDVRSYIHLHPEVEIRREDDSLVCQRGATTCIIHSDADITVEERWYCPEFGKRLRNDVLVIGGEVELPCRMTYVVRL